LKLSLRSQPRAGGLDLETSAASALGLRFQPVSQVLQEYPQMDELQSQFNALLRITPPAKVQMLVRVGRTGTSGLSPRRPLDAIVAS